MYLLYKNLNLETDQTASVWSKLHVSIDVP